MYTTLATSGKELNLEYVKGVTLGPIMYILRDRAGEPVDLSGAQVRAWIQRGLMGEKLVDMVVEKPDVNRFSVALPASETLNLPPVQLAWGIAIIWPTGQVDSPIYGSLQPVRLVPL